MHASAKHEAVASADKPGLIAPDTSGMNFYRADPALADLLRIHLSDELFRHIEPHLDRLPAPAARGPAPTTPRSPAVISTNARGLPTAMGRCCTSATVLAATRSGSNIIRPIANWKRPRSASSASTR